MLLLDAHVHIYNQFDFNVFFSSAFFNFSMAAKSLNIHKYISVIVLTDWSNQNWFRELSTLSDLSNDRQTIHHPFNFKIKKTQEEIALKILKNDSEELFLIAGRKIISAEDLEILALCSLQDFPDGKPLLDTIRLIDESGTIPVIPWAVGKWLGKRGTLLDELIDNPRDSFFYLCDNGNRPYFWPWPRHFKEAERNGIPIIAGSDPLHFSSEVSRIGRFGCLIDAHVTPATPGSEIVQLLREGQKSICRYGKLETGLRFVRNQLIMQLGKKKWRKDLVK